MFLKSSLLDSRKVRTNRQQAAQQPDRAEEREYGGPDQIDRSQCAIHIASGYRWRCCACGDACCGAAFAELDLSTEFSTCGSAPRVVCGGQTPRCLGFHWFFVFPRFHAGARPAYVPMGSSARRSRISHTDVGAPRVPHEVAALPPPSARMRGGFFIESCKPIANRPNGDR